MAYLLAIHVIAVICWFAGLFYLPRLFVYHAMTQAPGVRDQFKIMEHKLYWYIMTPAMVCTIGTGMYLMTDYIFTEPPSVHNGWLWVKLCLVFALVLFHFYCGHCLDRFKAEANRYSDRVYRILNEVPTVLLILIVILAVVKPF